MAENIQSTTPPVEEIRLIGKSLSRLRFSGGTFTTKNEETFQHDARESDTRDENFALESTLSSHTTVSCRAFYSIHTSSRYLPDIADQVYMAIASRVSSLEADVKNLFRYVVSIAWYARLVDVNVMHGAVFPRGTRLLRKVASGLMFPIVICEYIETLGMITMASGIKVIPYCGEYSTMMKDESEDFFDPLEAIQAHRRPDPKTDWSIDYDWISVYNTVITPQLQRFGVEIRAIHNKPVGRKELLIGFSNYEGLVIPKSPEVTSLTVAHKGASYRLRDYASFDEWPIGVQHLMFPGFTCERVSPTIVLSNQIMDSIKAKDRQT